jgi:hypothetical protein
MFRTPFWGATNHAVECRRLKQGMAMTDKPDGKDAPTTLSENALLRVVIGLVGISSLSAAVSLVILAMSKTNAALFSLGFVSALIGSGVSIWFALRIRTPAFATVSIWSLFALAFWS